MLDGTLISKTDAFGFHYLKSRRIYILEFERGEASKSSKNI